MPSDLPIRCTCGEISGTLHDASPANGNRIRCYCDDCQSFAHFLGGADEILDAHGGSDIYQTAPCRVTIERGVEQIACMRLTSSGLMRWYAGCCRAPIGNTMATRQMPFVGVLTRCIALDDAARDAALGADRGGLNGRFAKGDRAAVDAVDRAPLGMIVRMVLRFASARLRGQHEPHPFFDAASGEPIVAPEVLSAEERRRVEAQRDAV